MTTDSSVIRDAEYLDGDRMIVYEPGDNWGDGTPHIIGIPVEVQP